MPQIVAAVVAKSAMAAPVAATVAPTLAATGTAAAQTAALELAKQKAIQTSMQQMAAQGTKQAAVEATKQAGVEAAKQAGAEASRQGIMQGTKEAAQNQTIEAFKQSQLNPNRGVELGKFAGDVTSLPSAPAGPLSPAGSTPNLEALKAQTIQSGSPQFSQAQIVKSGSPIAPESKLLAEQAARIPPVSKGSPITQADAFRAITPEEATLNELRRSAASTGEKFAAEEAAANMSPLQKGINEGLNLFKEGSGKLIDIAKDKPLETSLGLMTVGQLMNQPKQGGEDKNKYKNTVDMSEFQPSIASVEPFTPSYEYQKYAAEGGLMKYAVGGPIETMSAQNAVGGNMMYPQAGLQTGLYSNPMIQRPEPVNVIAASGEPAVGAYSGEAKFASGGLSAAERREYGLQTRSQRASRSLTKSYEEKEKEREKELMNLLSERSDPGIIPRSRKQQLGFNPFATAAADYAGLAKKNKVPVAAMPKTSLGDIETYMDVPIEAAGGGIMHGLGGYSDGGRLLRGPGDGVSDSIPAVIGKRQPARLADGEFVIPARIVSELGNGSTEAGARKLYAMMERVQKSRKKSIGKKKVAVNSKADKHLPA
jgi:hypothetical protein